MSNVGLTSRWIAAARAAESERPDRLFDDPLADALARADGLNATGDDGVRVTPMSVVDAVVLRSLRSFGAPYLAIRTRFLDDVLLRAVADEEIDQVVILAAGMDARAFRLPGLSGVRLYELDLPDVLAAKQAVIETLGAAPLCTRVTLGVDLTDPAWVDVLRAAGFDPERRSAWLVEGLFMYLTADEGRALLRMVAGLAAPRSRLGADLIGARVLAQPLLAPFLATMAAQGHPFRSGTDTPELLFAGAGWAATARQPGEAGAGYGRWPWPVPPRTFRAIPRVFLVEAQRATRAERRPLSQQHSRRVRARELILAGGTANAR